MVPLHSISYCLLRWRPHITPPDMGKFWIGLLNVTRYIGRITKQGGYELYIVKIATILFQTRFLSSQMLPEVHKKFRR